LYNIKRIIQYSMTENGSQLLGNKYRILQKIGEGTFGKVFSGENARTKELVAIKMEPLLLDIKLLKNETKAYLLLAKETGFPRIKWYGANAEDFYMVIDYLGPSLSSFKKEAGDLDTGVVAKLGVQMIERVKAVHSVGLLHRDIKPDNFLFGHGATTSKSHILHLVDFGLCRSYRHANGTHIPEKTGKALIGSLFFVSLNVHLGVEPSRRDDLESVIYIMAYLLLPNFLKEEVVAREERVIEDKRGLMQVKGTIIERLLKYCRGLRFDEEPNYDGLIAVLKKEID